MCKSFRFIVVYFLDLAHIRYGKLCFSENIALRILAPEMYRKGKRSDGERIMSGPIN